MKFLVTGATGFIGKRLVRLLLSQGHGVNYLARKRDPSMDSRAAFLLWDGTGEPPLDCMGRLDAVVHLAGEPVAQRWNDVVKQRIRDSRVLGTRALVSAIQKLRHKPGVLVSASAIGYYGERGDVLLTEDSTPGNDFLAKACVEWEKEAERAREAGLRVTRVRISIVLGPDGGALPKVIQPFRFGLGGTLGSGKQWMSWIHVDDVTRLLLFAAEVPDVAGPINAASPNPVTNRDFTRELSKAMHRPALFTIPRFALKAAMGEVADHMLDSMRVIPTVAQAHGFTFDYPKLPQALRDSLDQAGAIRPLPA